MKKVFAYYLLPFFVLFILIVIAYSPIVKNQFVWDDFDFIVNWTAIRNVDVITFFKGAYPNIHTGVYRPIPVLMMSLVYSLFKTNPFWYHLLGILLHVVVSFLLYIFLFHFTQKKRLSLISAVLWALHPVQSGAVAFVTANFGYMYTAIFFYLTLILFLFAQKINKKYYFLSLVVLTLALFSNETAIIIPIMIVLIQLFKQFSETQLTNKIVSWQIGLYFVIDIIYLILRFLVLKIPSGVPNLSSDPFVYPIFFLRVFLKYIFVLFVPVNLSVIYNFIPEEVITITPSERFIFFKYIDLSVIFSLLFIFGILYLAIHLRKKQKIISFSLFYFLLCLVPYSNIIFSRASFADRYMYFPSVGWSICVASIIIFVGKKFQQKNRISVKLTTYIPVFIILIYYMIRVFVRTFDWKDSVTLWSATLQRSPNSSGVNNNLGKAYADLHEYAKAIPFFEKSISINPHYTTAKKNLGLSYFHTSQYDKAISIYEDIKKSDPLDAEAIKMLSLLPKLKSGEIKVTSSSSLTNETDAKSLFDQGVLLYKSGYIDEAMNYFARAIVVDQNFVEPFINLSFIYISKKMSLIKLLIL